MNCKAIKHYKGTKTNVIMEMINDKKREEVEKEFPKLKKNQNVMALVAKIKKNYDEQEEIQEIYKEKQSKLEEQLKEFGLMYNFYYKKLEVLRQCHVPKKIFDKLQKADKLWSLNKRDEARKIWDEVIEEFKLI